MNLFNSDGSLIDDSRLLISDKEVTFTVQSSPDTKDEYSMDTRVYSYELEKSAKYGNPHGIAK